MTIDIGNVINLFSKRHDSGVIECNKALKDAEQLFVRGGVKHYINHCHNVALGTSSYGGTVGPRKRNVDRFEHNMLPNFAASMMNAMFSYSYELDDFHETWSPDIDPDACGRAQFSFLASSVFGKSRFSDLREGTKGNSLKSILSVSRLVARLRHADLLPISTNKSGTVTDPLMAELLFNDFKKTVLKHPSYIDDALKEVAVHSEELDDIQSSINKAFGSTPGDGYDLSEAPKVPIQSEVDLLDLLEHSRHWLTRFIEDVGKYSGILGAIRKKHKAQIGVPLPDIGDDFLSADPAEFALLKTEAKPSVLLRASLGLLSVTSPRESEQKAGPIVIAIDASGSMGGSATSMSDNADIATSYKADSRFNIARAIGVSVAVIAAKQNRPVRIFNFSKEVRSLLDLKVDGPVDPAHQLLAFASALKPSGGTSFSCCLEKAVEFNALNDGRSDLVIVTDGKGSLRRELEDDPRIFTILIGPIKHSKKRGRSDDLQHALRERSESFAHIPDISKPDQVNTGLITFSQSLDD